MAAKAFRRLLGLTLALLVCLTIGATAASASPAESGLGKTFATAPVGGDPCAAVQGYWYLWDDTQNYVPFHDVYHNNTNYYYVELDIYICSNSDVYYYTSRQWFQHSTSYNQSHTSLNVTVTCYGVPSSRSYSSGSLSVASAAFGGHAPSCSFSANNNSTYVYLPWNGQWMSLYITNSSLPV